MVVCYPQDISAIILPLGYPVMLFIDVTYRLYICLCRTIDCFSALVVVWHFQILWEIVLKEEASRSFAAWFLQVLCLKYMVSSPGRSYLQSSDVITVLHGDYPCSDLGKQWPCSWQHCWIHDQISLYVFLPLRPWFWGRGGLGLFSDKVWEGEEQYNDNTHVPLESRL